MRLTEKQLTAIKEAFIAHFSKTDSLWLFGSRVNDAAKGGDIDLYIETNHSDGQELMQKKSHFSWDIQKKIGEQKIDIIINSLPSNHTLRIYDEAKTTGVKLL